MKIRTLTAALAALGLGLACGLTASAGTVIQTQEFDFTLLPQTIDEQPREAAAGDLPTPYWYGDTQKLFNPFDDALGTLNKTKLSVQMNITGTLYVFDLPVPDLEAQADSVEGYLEYPQPEGPSIQALGAALSGPLTAEVDFGEYVFGEDGELVEDGIEIYESGEGDDMTSDPGELGFFQGESDVPVDLLAALIVDYGETLQIGEAESFNASGEVTLQYDFSDDGGDSTVIPSPAALPAGLLVLGGLALRRRRTPAND
jgi:MYXO-CTERM domain-containing protein